MNLEPRGLLRQPPRAAAQQYNSPMFMIRHPAPVLLTLLVGAAAAQAWDGGADPDAVPDPLRVPDGQVLALAARGVGVQIYECSAAKDGASYFSWSLKGPDAILRSQSGKRLGKHYAGPTWEADDGSRVTGELVAKADAPRASAVPWLLLRAESVSGTGIFSNVVSIQRLHTVGGTAPAGGCDEAHAGDVSRVRYSAEYRFYSPES